MRKFRAQINVNDPVYVKLTPLGYRLHLADHEQFLAALPSEVRSQQKYRPPEVDADGFWHTSMWHLMQLFGSHVGLGFQVPFETTVEVEIGAE